MLQGNYICRFWRSGCAFDGTDSLSYAAMIENREVSWMPSYGPEMRGGTANCITIISDEAISSPIISKI